MDTLHDNTMDASPTPPTYEHATEQTALPSAGLNPSLHQQLPAQDPLLLAYIEHYQQQSAQAMKALPSAPVLRPLSSNDISHLAAALGRDARNRPWGIIDCPRLVYEETDWNLMFRGDLTSVDSMEVVGNSESPVQYSATRPHGHAGYNCRRAIGTYDTEYVVSERDIADDEEKGIISENLTLVSHQWYFSLGLENFCVILISSRRFSQKAFVREFLANVVPDTMVTYTPAGHYNPNPPKHPASGPDVSSINRIPISKLYMAAHASQFDAGSLIPSFDKVESKPTSTAKAPKTYDSPVIECKKKQWIGKSRARDRKNPDTEYWIGGVWKSSKELFPPNRARRRAKSTRQLIKQVKQLGLWVHFADTLNLILGSLKKAGDSVGIPKLDVGESISNMAELWRTDPEKFLQYAARDVITTGQVLAFFDRVFDPLTGGMMATRIAKYAEIFMRHTIEKIYTEHVTGTANPVDEETGKPIKVPKKDLMGPMGRRPILISTDTDEEGISMEDYLRSLMPAELLPAERPITIDDYLDYLIDRKRSQGEIIDDSEAERALMKVAVHRDYMKLQPGVRSIIVPTQGIVAFLPYCIGSRAECWVSGVMGKLTYVDLKSAFCSALLMAPDYDFQTCYSTTGTACMDRIKELWEGGPFQIIGVEISWIFKSGAQPTFPRRVKGKKFNGQETEKLIFTTSDYGHIMWTELYMALEQDLLADYLIHSIIEFKPLKTHHLATQIHDLLAKRRGDENGVYKACLTHSFGKFFQGFSDIRDNPYNSSSMSSISIFPIAAYELGVCRAVIGELLQLNECYAVASDAVIIAGHEPVKTGPLAKAIQNKMTDLDFTFVETEFLGIRGLFQRTRGYLLEGYKVKNGVVSSKLTHKMANMGMKTDNRPDELDPDLMGHQKIDGFMTGLITGKLRCFNHQSFPDLQAQYADNAAQRKELQRLLRNSRNQQLRLRLAGGISRPALESEYHRLQPDVTFKQFEAARVADFIARDGKRPKTLAQVLKEYSILRQQYEEVVNYQIFPRKYFYTINVNTTSDFKRCLIPETLRRDTFELDYGPSDGSSSKKYSYEHVAFKTRPVYSADEYQQLLHAATHRMDYEDYVSMMDELRRAGVLSNYYGQSTAKKKII